MTTKHTPTPWLMTWSDNGIACFNDGNGLHFLNVRNVRGDDQAIQTEDAALIVRAVNARDDMLAALKRAAECIDEALDVHIYGEDDERPEPGDECECNFTNTLESIRAAIAKAEEA